MPLAPLPLAGEGGASAKRSRRVREPTFHAPRLIRLNLGRSTPHPRRYAPLPSPASGARGNGETPAPPPLQPSYACIPARSRQCAHISRQILMPLRGKMAKLGPPEIGVLQGSV